MFFDGQPAMVFRKALFLDRDGVVNVDRGYVHRIEDFEFTPGIFDLCRQAQQRGYLIVIITNQSGIARGLYGGTEYRRLTDWMRARFLAEGIEIAAIYQAPYHPTEGAAPWRREHPWRKPGPGMILDAARALTLDLGASVLIGDQPSDIAAARAAGIGTAILLAESPDKSADLVVPTLRGAHDWLMQHTAAPPA
jgi:D-glycero-D-manno-heptose 1,7-bisphosphate phosphatase